MTSQRFAAVEFAAHDDVTTGSGNVYRGRLSAGDLEPIGVDWIGGGCGVVVGGPAWCEIEQTNVRLTTLYRAGVIFFQGMTLIEPSLTTAAQRLLVQSAC